jgi:site-specific DNA-methyltransferase (adenine-specific)
MASQPLNKNVLFYGDNLPILRSMPASSVDLIYLDPPFNSSRSYNVLFKDESGISSDAQITAFDDTWHWGPSAEQAYLDILQANPGVVDDLLAALRTVIGENQMLAYLIMMAARLVELHRVLRPSGSLYLHCDPTASHYLKIILDTVFGFQNFQNEIIWKRTSAHSDAKQGNVLHMGRIHDTILYYTKSIQAIHNEIYQPYDESYLNSFYKYKDPDGRRYRLGDITGPGGASKGNPQYEFLGIVRYWRYKKERMEELYKQSRIVQTKPGAVPQYKRYLDEMSGLPLQDIWDDIPPIGAQAAERLGYPTQKPLPLLERIIQASSNPGDIILDPFCGCGTAIAAAEKLGRQWIGIDITYLSINLIENRMKAMFPGIQFEVIGKPEDLGSARNLAQRDRYQFQWWTLSLVGAKPLGGSELGGTGKKGSDKGIDGVINYIDSAKQELKRVLVQVKSGHVNASTIRDLIGTLNNEHAEIGVLITLESPTRDMITAASTAGFYQSQFWQKTFPRLQILTIEQILAGSVVQMPPETGTFLVAQKVRKSEGTQNQLEI